MNVEEMQYSFGMHLSQFDEPMEADSDDIQYWLNQAQITIVKEKFNGLNEEGRGFEQSTERVADLQGLLRTSNVTTVGFAGQTLSGYNLDYAQLPANCLFVINHSTVLYYNFPSVEWEEDLDNKRQVTGDFTEYIAKNRVGSQDSILKLLNDPFNTTRPQSPLTTIQSNGIVIYTDETFVADRINVSYLKKPVDVNIKAGTDSELPEHLHKEIVERAVEMFVNNAKLKRPQEITVDTTLNTQNNE